MKDETLPSSLPSVNRCLTPRRLPSPSSPTVATNAIVPRVLIWPAFKRGFENRRRLPAVFARHPQLSVHRLRSDEAVRGFAESLQVTALLEPRSIDHHNVIGVEIRSELWAQPVPLELLVRTEIDLETGKVQIADLLPTRAG